MRRRAYSAGVAHLVWDWNGTLLDDTPLVVAATNATLTSRGARPVTVEDYRREFSRPVPEYYGRVLGRPMAPDEFAALDEEFHAVYRAGVATVDLAADAREALAAWGGTQSLLSMFFHDDLVGAAARLGIAGAFARVDGLRAAVGGGPKAPHLVAHLAALGVPAGEVVLVGDTVDDAAAARAAGAAVVLYAGGITDEARLHATGVPVAPTLVGAVALAAGLVAA
jgi:phosphoglycolate phosphatase-like HAD superfamily hydrolase